MRAPPGRGPDGFHTPVGYRPGTAWRNDKHVGIHRGEYLKQRGHMNNTENAKQIEGDQGIQDGGQMKYTVRLDRRRVIAWTVVRETEEGNIYMEPVLLPLDPNDQGQGHQGQALRVRSGGMTSSSDCAAQTVFK